MRAAAFVNAVAGLLTHAHAGRPAGRAARARTQARPRAAARALGSAPHRSRPAGASAAKTRATDDADAAARRHRRARLRALSTRRHRARSRSAGPRRRGAACGSRVAESRYRDDCERTNRENARPRRRSPRAIGPDCRRSATSWSKGPIGVGKTSLARRLADTLEAELVLEQDAQNPVPRTLLPAIRKSGALPAQLFFLFQRAQQLGTLKQQDLFAPRRVADYLFEKDRLFAGAHARAGGDGAVRAGGLAPRRGSAQAGPGGLPAGAGGDAAGSGSPGAASSYENAHRRQLSRASQRRLCAVLPRVRPRAAA